MASYFLTRKVALKVAHSLAWSVDQSRDITVYPTTNFALVITDPTVRYIAMEEEENEWIRFITKAVLLVHRVGDQSSWKYPFDLIALGKAFLSWKYELSSCLIQQQLPHLLQLEDTVFGGSVVGKGGQVVAVSGFSEEQDEGLSSNALGLLEKLVQEEAKTYRTDHPDSNFIGGKLRKTLPGYNLSTYTGRYDTDLRCPNCDEREKLKYTNPPQLTRRLRCRQCGYEGWEEEFMVSKS